MRSALLVVLAVIMGGCDRPVAEFAAGESCAGQGFKITDDFPGARRGTCVVYESGKAEINIHPEDSGEINNSQENGATPVIAASPAGCPNESLTDLK